MKIWLRGLATFLLCFVVLMIVGGGSRDLLCILILAMVAFFFGYDSGKEELPKPNK